METFNTQDVGALAPVITLIVGGCALLISEVFLKSRNRGYQAGVSAAFAALAGVIAWNQADNPARDIFFGFARADAFGSFLAVLVCFSLALTSIVSASYLKELASERGEFHGLLHFAGAGMILLAMTTDLITLFVALEVMSLATYGLTAYLRSSARPAEAGIKYFILGSFSSAVFLYGASLAYGAAGSTKMADIASAIAASNGPTPLVWVALALIIAGFFFKVAAVPFHTWAPDVYQGAPTTVTGFMASGVKAAAVAALVRTLYVAFGSQAAALGTGTSGKGWYTAVATVAAITMVAGNLLAIVQRSVKRMLAYSSISHAGYLLVGVAVGAFGPQRQEATQATLFYLAAYTATAVGAFAIVAALERRGGAEIDDDTRYDGLGQRHPVLAATMALFMLSLAGIPPTAGFMAKFFIFRAALDAGAVWLTVLGLVSSIAGLWYYLRVIVVMYMRPAQAADHTPPRMGSLDLGLLVASIATVLLGIGPGVLTDFARAASVLGQ